MQVHKLVQLVIKLDFIFFLLTIKILLYSIIEQNVYIQILILDPKSLFINVKVGKFIKLFDKSLLKKHIITIYNGKTKK